MVYDEDRDRVVKGLLEAGRGGRAVHHGRHQGVVGEGVHRPVVIGSELGAVAVGAGADGTLEWVEGLLGFLAAQHAQPVLGRQLVGRAVGQREAIGHHHKGAVRPGVAHPAEVHVVLQLGVDELAIGPVAHGVEGTAALDQLFDCLVPGQSRVIVVLVVKHAAIDFHSLLDLRAVKGNRAVPQPHILLGTDDAHQRVLEEFG